jgi:hypothetical protein
MIPRPLILHHTVQRVLIVVSIMSLQRPRVSSTVCCDEMRRVVTKLIRSVRVKVLGCEAGLKESLKVGGTWAGDLLSTCERGRQGRFHRSHTTRVFETSIGMMQVPRKDEEM